ncbi:MAG: glycosyltransferase family 4 protein [Firmicutes bacterium]|nr:glycosyltransferase family 4 protein [Bacillota bacterium]
MPDKKEYKVLHIITDCQPFGGAQRNTWLSVSRADSRFPQSLACGEGEALPQLCRENNIPFYRIDGLQNDFNPGAELRAVNQMKDLIKKEKFDIVHLHSTKAGILGRIAAKLAGAPYIFFTIHGVSFDFELRPRSAPLLLFLEKVTARFTDGIVSVAQNCKDDFVNKGVCKTEKIRVIYSAIEFDPIDSATAGDDLKKELGISDSDWVVGAVGHFRKAKGYEYLVEAAPAVLKIIPNVKFLIIGDGPEKQDIERRIREKGLQNAFILAGDRADVPNLLKVMHAFCRPSIHEGLGRALTEAMYAGLPPVVTDIWGTREVCEHDKTGILVPIRDPEALAKGIIRLKTEPSLGERIGSAAREKVVKIFGVETMVRGIEKYYLETIEEKNGKLKKS